MRLRSLLSASLSLALVLPAFAGAQEYSENSGSVPFWPDRTNGALGGDQMEAERLGEQDRSDARARLGEGEREEAESLQELIRSSTEAYRKLVPPGDTERQRVAREARCVAVFPDIVEAAVVLGGRHADGIASCKTDSGWSAVSFLNLTGASIGAQLGAKRTDMVMFFMDPQGEQQLKNGELEFGAGMEVTYGGSGRGIETDWRKSDVVAFSEAAGLLAAASFQGTSIRADEGQLEDYYGRQTKQQEVLGTPITNAPGRQTEARSFVTSLPS